MVWVTSYEPIEFNRKFAITAANTTAISNNFTNKTSRSVSSRSLILETIRPPSNYRCLTETFRSWLDFGLSAPAKTEQNRSSSAEIVRHVSASFASEQYRTGYCSCAAPSSSKTHPAGHDLEKPASAHVCMCVCWSSSRRCGKLPSSTTTTWYYLT